MHKILIVEQDRALNNGIALALKAESYLFLQAFGLKEADELLKKQKVELVILDLNLPDGDEVEFLKNIKEDKVVDIKYCVDVEALIDREQIYCFSALVIYKD